MSRVILKTKDGGIQKYTVSKILCMAINYPKHAGEMHSQPPEAPVLFLKPPSAIIHSGETVVLPAMSNEVHHEVEMVALIGKKGSKIAQAQALEYVAGYGVGLDMTMRDQQKKAKEKGRPWSIAKGFDTSAPISDFISADLIKEPQAASLKLYVNGHLRQNGNTADMIFKLDTIIAWASQIFTLEPGDLIFTGTPDGVGPVQVGDVLKATLNELKLEVSII